MLKIIRGNASRKYNFYMISFSSGKLHLISRIAASMATGFESILELGERECSQCRCGNSCDGFEPEDGDNAAY